MIESSENAGTTLLSGSHLQKHQLIKGYRRHFHAFF